MPLSISYTAGYTFAAGELVTEDKLNQLGNPTINLSGSISSASIADGSVTTAKLANGALSADSTGRAKMADLFITLAKINTGIFTADAAGRAPFASGWLSLDLIGAGIFTADVAGRAPFVAGFVSTALLADGGVTMAKLAAGIIDAATSKATPVLADEILLGDSAATFATKKTTLTALKTAVGGTTRFASANTTLWASASTGGTATIAHSLGAAPVLLRATIVCVTNDAATGWAANDEIEASAWQGDSTSGTPNRGLAFYADATNVNAVASTGKFYLPAKTTGTPTQVTSNANFKIKVYAWL